MKKNIVNRLVSRENDNFSTNGTIYEKFGKANRFSIHTSRQSPCCLFPVVL